MLLVHPVSEVVKLAPVLLVSVLIGSQSGNHTFGLIAVAVLVAFALLRWYTTSYRLGPVHVQLRSGVFQRNLLSVPRNRIRSVDVEAGLLHRLLGLAVVRIGTGQQSGRGSESGRFELNALDAALVPALRAALLARPDTSGPVSDAGAAPPPARPETEIAHWTPAWVRYAPFSVTGLITIAAVVGLAFQYGIAQRLTESETVSGWVDSARHLGVAALAAAGVLALLLVASTLACARYLIAYGNLRVTDDGRVLHVSHGLLKTRQTTLDRARLRGTTLREPLLLRLAGGARLDAIMTGVSAEKQQSSMLLPQAPAVEAKRMMGVVLGERRFPADADLPLRPHGPAARRRRYSRALLPVGVVAVAVGAAGVLGVRVHWSVWPALAVAVVAAAVLAWDRYRGLGHAVPAGWLVTRSGSLDRGRHSLEADGIIGWTVRQTFFQRRAGVATVVAATPAGTRRYEVLDLPADEAWALVESVTPGAGGIWTRSA
ncbi:PH domain-containing protein [Rhodococcus kronopolitis]|uniref:PH domain-containing protein n=1 Tax=Rhodococcus kronopolitis TaxID=1460226 RepID=A0ABV9FZ40_9NOCA